MALLAGMLLPGVGGVEVAGELACAFARQLIEFPWEVAREFNAGRRRRIAPKGSGHNRKRMFLHQASSAH